MARTKSRSRARPLLVRPGARFQCAGDGLCCTDIHALGPLTRREARDLRRDRPGSVVYSDEIGDYCMRPLPTGGCAQLDGKGRCTIHVRNGAEAKPTGCTRFPYSLIATPRGGRVTTEHRCSCRSLGDRPPIDLNDAERSLRDRAGRLEVELHAPATLLLTREKRVSFARYESLEAALIERLFRGERAEEVLGAAAFPALHRGGWRRFAGEFLDMRDGTAGGVATAWFGDALLALLDGHEPPRRARPWRAAFDRGVARAKRPGNAEQIINDWIADELWMLRWLAWGCPFDVARAELATRLAAARWVEGQLRNRRVRADQAAAEAVMIAALAGATEEWPEVVEAIANDPSPASVIADSTPEKSPGDRPRR